MNPRPPRQPEARDLDPPFRYTQLRTRFEHRAGTMWVYLDASPRPCFNPVLLEELSHCYGLVSRLNRSAVEQGIDCPVPYVVAASTTPGVFSLGGDLGLFRKMIGERDREGLWRYAEACIRIVHNGANNFFLPMTTIALVQGDAFGGGMEAAICCNVVVAEKRARFGLPEILFNLFPGMGAYSLLARRLGPARAERIIAGGNTHTAQEFHELGVVDVLAEDGEGERAVQEFIDRHGRRRNAFQALFRVRQRFHPLEIDELRDIARIWVEAALQVPERDLRIMERVGRAQDRLPAGQAAPGGAEGAGA